MGTACTADGLVDADRLKDISDRLQERLPSKTEFERMAEDHIATLPADEQVQARIDLAKALSEWPTEAELDRKLDEAIDEFAEHAPSRAEVEDALGEVSNQLPTKDELRDLLEEMPEDDQLKEGLNKGLSQFFEALDSVGRELEKQE